MKDHIYVDKAISASNIEPRDGFKKLLEVAQSKDVPFTYILVYDTSRVARNTREALEVFEDLTFNNVYVYYVSQNIDTQKPEAKTMITIHGVTDSMFLEKISFQTRDHMKERVKNGFSGGGSHYGYTSRPVFSGKKDKYGTPLEDGYKIEIDPDEAYTVQRIFTWFGLKGWSAKRIVNFLNKELKETGGPKPPRGEQWCVSTVLGSRKGFRGILNNELYLGKYKWNRTTYKKNPKTGKPKAVINPPEKWAVVKKPELRIISDDLWAAVKNRQKEIKDDTKGIFNRAKYLYSENLLTRITVCGTCGGTFGIASGGKYAKYGCVRNHNSGNSTCSNTVKIKKEVLEEAIITTLCRELINKDPLSLITEEIHCSLGGIMKDAIRGRQRDEIEKEIEVVKQRLENIANFILSSPAIENTETVEKLLLRNEKQKKDLENELLLYRVSDVESMNVAGLITMKDLENYFLKIIDGLINPATTRETLYSIVDGIVINCKEEVFIDVEIRENIKKTIGYILDLIGKRDPRIQSISGTGYRLYTSRVFKCRILIAPHSKAIMGAENVLIA
jgi:DNA invertase Pin-like site-specific DNA recombinase